MQKLIKNNFDTFNKHIKKVFFDNGVFDKSSKIKKFLKVHENSWENHFSPLYNETGLKWLELIDKFDFKIFYFKTSSICDEKLSFKNTPKELLNNEYNSKNFEKNYIENLGKDDKNVKKIKKLQCDDLTYLYKNMIFEVLYIPQKLITIILIIFILS